MVNEENIDKILCSGCGIQTNQKIVWKGETSRQEAAGGDIWTETNYDLLQCLGCEGVTLRRRHIFSEDMDFEEINGKTVVKPEVTLWPKISRRMLKMKYFNKAPPSVKRTYRETMEAYNSELPTLCSAGIRSIIEAVCKEEGVSGSDLKERVDSLCKEGLITKGFAEALHENRLLGNDALHKLTLFGDTELSTAIELIESLIEAIYETKTKTNLLKALRKSKHK